MVSCSISWCVRQLIDPLLIRADCCANVYQEWIARKVRGIAEPFGGIQVSPNLSGFIYCLYLVWKLVLSGDFFQLPPVPEKSHRRIQPVSFAFDAKTWTSCITRPIFLTQVFRQKDVGLSDLLRLRYWLIMFYPP
jgi:hypothetical protein